MVIRSWRDAKPHVGHENKIIWSIFRSKGIEDLEEDEACLLGISGLTVHRLQPGCDGDYHDHENKEQVYYFTEGRAKMKIDGEIYEVRAGDAVHLPPKCMHQIVNDTDDWVEHLIISATVDD